MENKLQELTNKIHSEGILKAEKEGEEIKEKAKNEAAKIIKDANKKSDKIVEQAEARAVEIRKNVMAELKLSANQAVSAVKQKVADLIILKLVDKPVKEAFQDKDFIKKIIETLVRNWSSIESGSAGLMLMLPEKDKVEIENYFLQKQQELFKSGLEIKVDDTLTTGFRIAPKDGSFMISFTDEDFSNFIKSYLRPRTIKLLYKGDK
jgi:V/A-type H+-transporting ATPase subunit E